MQRTYKKALPHIVLIAYVAVILIPFAFVLLSSLKTNNVEISKSPFGLPESWRFLNYKETWLNAKINVYFWNSLYLSTIAAAIGVFLAAATAFALTRMKFKQISKAIYQFILVGMLIPGNVLFIAQYLLVSKMNILDTHWALFLPYTAGALPFSVLLISAFMRSLPSELEEAAIVDGLSSPMLFVKIILPLTIPALVTMFIINFLGNWNEFLLSNFFISTDKLKTLPTGLFSLRDAYASNYAQICTGIVISVAPVLLIYTILQEKIIEGLTAGGVKG